MGLMNQHYVETNEYVERNIGMMNQQYVDTECLVESPEYRNGMEQSDALRGNRCSPTGGGRRE